VKPTRTIPQPDYRTTEPAVESNGLTASWTRFWFVSVDPIGLHVIRVSAGLLFLAWLLPLAGNIDSLFGLQGWVDRQAYVDAAKMQADLQKAKLEGDLDALKVPDRKPISWSVLYLANNNPVLLGPIYWTAIGIFVLFTLGLWTRVTSVLTWIMVASFTANPAFNPDVNPFLLILSLYLMVGYVLMAPGGKNQSRLAWLLGWTAFLRLDRATAKPEAGRASSIGANVALRLLQVHLAIVIVTSGLHKLQFSEWWAGHAFWYQLFPPYETTLAAVRAYAPTSEFLLGVLSLAAYVTLAWQLSFPMFAWKSRWRWLVIGGAIVGWLGSAFLYGIPLVGPALFIGCLSYVTASEWDRILGLLNRIPFLRRSTQWLYVAPESKTRIRRDQPQPVHLVAAGQP
jgi:hypothetical protein